MDKFRNTIRAGTIPNVIEEIKLKIHHNVINQVKKPDILIAGCGTTTSIETATRFKSSKVLAIDLSLSSLAYAKLTSSALKTSNTCRLIF